MPNLHLTKVAFGCRDLESLKRRAIERSSGDERRIPTRMRPKRAEELVGGNLYWIVKHRLIACQPILRFDDRDDGRIDIVCAAELTPIVPIPRRAHQGWRYFEADSLPTGDDSGIAELPPRLYGKLASLALV